MANICLFCLLCVLNLRSGEARVAMTNAIKGATEKVQEPLHERVCTAVVALAAACVSRTAPSASWHKIQTASHAFRMPGSDVTRETEVLSIRRSKYRRTSRLMTVQFGRCRATHAQHTHIHTRARSCWTLSPKARHDFRSCAFFVFYRIILNVALLWRYYLIEKSSLKGVWQKITDFNQNQHRIKTSIGREINWHQHLLRSVMSRNAEMIAQFTLRPRKATPRMSE